MNNNIKNIYDKLKKINKKLYIVWWFCREKILWNSSYDDIDLVTDANPDEMKSILNIVWEVWKKYGTCIVYENWESFEITTFRKDIWTINNRKPVLVEFTDNLELDSQRRDFTCNSIYFDIENDLFLDPQNWIQDLNSNTLRFVWNIQDRIHEDALRILRYIRFKNKYNFNVADEKYWEIFKDNIILLKNISIERIKQELDKMLLSDNNINALDDLKRIWFLRLFIPELDCLNNFPWNKYHLEWDVWIHTKMCVNEMNKIIKRENIYWDRKLLLIWAILLHDIWKWLTLTIWEDWEAHYYNHEEIWADVFKNDLVFRLKFPSYFEKRIDFIIREHLRLFKIPSMKNLKSRKLMMEEYFDDLLLVWEADNRWRFPKKEEDFQKILDIYNDFKIIIKEKIFFTWQDIMIKYPELKWREIWEKMKQLNDQILAK